ncbi:MAG: TraB/GumN family protein [Luteibacter sp.]
MTPTRLRRSLALFGFLLIGALPAFAQTAPPTPPSPDPSVPTLEAVTVSGEQPGPGLWRVTRGEHTLLILGTLTPLPKNMTWRTAEIDQELGHTDALILPPKVEIKPNTGFFGRLALLPSLIGVRNSPDGKTLQESVPPEVYTRWLTVKAKYIGDDRKVERYRPIFAVLELYKAAVRKTGMSRSGGVTRTVMDLATKHGVKQVPVEYTLLVDDPRAAVKSFKQSTLDDTSCFAQSIDNIDAQLADMATRANAWATGDLAALRDERTAKQRLTCMNAATDSGVAQKIGLTDVPKAVRERWMAAVDAAMAANAQTLAIVPLDDLLGADGYLSALQARGYKVVAPDEDN